MSQLSLFSADLTPPLLADLGGLLAAHGQVTTDDRGTALSMVLEDRWRAEAMLREFRVRDIPARLGAVPDEITGGRWLAGSPPRAAVPSADTTALDPDWTGVTLLSTDRVADLGALAADWTRGAVKATPRGLLLTPGFVRCWVIAAGRPSDVGVVLGLDPHAPDTHEPLAAACAAAGLAGSLLGVRGGGPAMRIVGYRRCSRLVEMIGTPPPEAPPGAFPTGRH